MKKITIGIGIIALVGILSIIMALMNTPSTRLLDGISFVETYQKTPGAVLLDVRTPSEYAQGHLEGAVNIDYQNPAFLSEIQQLDKSQPYFVYCHSGRRSAGAILVMRKEGFTNIYEMQGGVSGNTETLTLVQSDVALESEYVVDQSDLLDGEKLVAGIITYVLSEKERNGILLMREEEKLARDVYTTLGAKWGLRIFSNIASSEQTHMNAMKVLVDRYALPDPSKDNTIGVFTSPQMQKLYNDLTMQGEHSMLDALVAGATVEDLDVLKKETNKEDILVVYENLQKGSRNHLRAFMKNISMKGGTYTPQYISVEAFAEILNGAQERGRAR